MKNHIKYFQLHIWLILTLSFGFLMWIIYYLYLSLTKKHTVIAIHKLGINNFELFTDYHIQNLMYVEEKKIVIASIVLIIAIALIIFLSYNIAKIIVKPYKESTRINNTIKRDKKIFTTNFLHELRTPITFIKGAIEQITRVKTDKIEKHLNWLEILDEGVKRLSDFESNIHVIVTDELD